MEIIATIAGIVTIIAGIAGTIGWARKKYYKKKLPAISDTQQDDVWALLDRYLLIFEEHGLRKSQIPRFLKEDSNITIEALSSKEKLVSVLSNNHLNEVCNIFGIQREWLEGKDIPIFPLFFFYRKLGGLVRSLSEIKKKYGYIEIFFIKSPKDNLEKTFSSDKEIAVVIRAPLTPDGSFEDPIYRYFPLTESYFWGSRRTRLHIKAIALIGWQFKASLYGVEMPENQIADLIEGSVFPDALLRNSNKIAWRPDDYIFTHKESLCLADPEEAIEVREAMKEWGVLKILESITGKISDSIPFSKKTKLE